MCGTRLAYVPCLLIYLMVIMTYSSCMPRFLSARFNRRCFSMENSVKNLASGLFWTLCVLLSACQNAPVTVVPVLKPKPVEVVEPAKKKLNPEWVAALSIVNTNENTYLNNGVWESTMGPLSTSRGGLACDNVAPDMRYHTGDYKLWYLAPSDAEKFLNMKKCSPNTQGKRSEPSCYQNWDLCGRKVRVKCLDTEFCGKRGELSLASNIEAGMPIVNNYLPMVFVKELSQLLGAKSKAPDSIVLYITDFCPADHSNNIKLNQCQRPQVDISTSAFLLLGKANKAGYINTGLDVSVELLPPDDATAVGPEY